MAQQVQKREVVERWEEFFDLHAREDLLELATGSGDLQVEYGDLERFDIELADELVRQPDGVLSAAEKALGEVDLPVELEASEIEVQVVGLPEEDTHLIRDLRSEHIGRLISVEGVVRKATEVRPKLTKAVFECQRCGERISVNQKETDYSEPTICRGCERKGPFSLIEKESEFVDAQKIKIQESPEDLEGGEQPQGLDVNIRGHLAGDVTPGNRITANGVLRSYQRTNRGQKKTVFELYQACNSIEIEDQEFEKIEISEEEKEEIRELADDPGIYGKIIDSIAPTIWGYEEVKEAVAMQLFGGLPKQMPDGSYIRGDIHVLVIGDPGMGKSQILRYVKNLAPRGVYASGKSSSAAGLTAAAVRDEFGDGQWSLEAGALVLADKGVAAIDEVDKMRDEDRSALHEAMEQQSISIAKAGITTTLQTRCALLGAANPKYGRYDMHEPIADQIDMEPALLSRFDLIFTLKDQPSRDEDSEIAGHILNSHESGQLIERGGDPDTEEVEPPIEPDLMRKYVSMARNVIPVMKPEAKERLLDFYVDLRNEGGEDSPVPVTARQLEALVRLAEASAKMRLDEQVKEEDARRAIKIVKECLKEVGVDPDTGEFDIDVVSTGVSKSQRDRIRNLKDIIRELEMEFGGKAPEEEIVDRAMEEDMTRSDVKSKLQKLRKEGDIYKPDGDNFKLA